MQRFVTLLFWFGYQQALSCLFPAFIFVSLAVSHLVDIPGLPRYDLLLALCIGMQVYMVKSGLETRDELKVITLFHLIGPGLDRGEHCHLARRLAVPEPKQRLGAGARGQNQFVVFADHRQLYHRGPTQTRKSAAAARRFPPFRCFRAQALITRRQADPPAPPVGYVTFRFANSWINCCDVRGGSAAG
jgi:hypothetical protein